MYNDFPGENVSHAQEGTQYPISRRMTPIPVFSSADIRLNATDFRALIAVSGASDGAGWCWQTQRELATTIHRNRDTVSRALARLTRWGYLVAGHGMYDRERRQKRQTVYRLAEPEEPAP